MPKGYGALPGQQRPIVVHDYFLAPDGGSRLAMALAESFGAELWAGAVADQMRATGLLDASRYHDLRALDSAPRWLGFSSILQYWQAFARFPEREALWAVFSGSLSLLAHPRIHISGNGRGKILYCHTPPRLLYDQRRLALRQVPAHKRPFLLAIMAFYRRAYEKAFQSMDLVVTNSRNVARRIDHYLGRESVVVYPPCETGLFHFHGQKDYYLSTARVDFLKRVDLIVEAFRVMKHKRLIVVSGGDDLPRIRRMAEESPNIQVLGWVDEQTLRDLVGSCVATIYIPREEDFGISPIESMAAGKPVIGVKEGGLLETVIEGKTGALVPSNPDVEDVIKAVEEMSPEVALSMKDDCRARAEHFSRDRFVAEMGLALKHSLQ